MQRGYNQLPLGNKGPTHLIALEQNMRGRFFCILLRNMALRLIFTELCIDFSNKVYENGIPIRLRISCFPYQLLSNLN